MEPDEKPNWVFRAFKAVKTVALKISGVGSATPGPEDVPLLTPDETSSGKKDSKDLVVGLASIGTYISPKQDVIGYKTVNVVAGRKLLANARLRLRIPSDAASIYRAGYRGIEAPGDLVPSKKYSTNRALVEGAEIIAQSPGLLRAAYLALQTGYAEFASCFDANFKYPLGGYVNEPAAGKGGGPCGQGIFFFIDKAGPYEYARKAAPTWLLSSLPAGQLLFRRLGGVGDDVDETDEDAPDAKARRLSELATWVAEHTGSTPKALASTKRPATSSSSTSSSSTSTSTSSST